MAITPSNASKVKRINTSNKRVAISFIFLIKGKTVNP
jgi:hypothetical protein